MQQHELMFVINYLLKKISVGNMLLYICIYHVVHMYYTTLFTTGSPFIWTSLMVNRWSSYSAIYGSLGERLGVCALCLTSDHFGYRCFGTSKYLDLRSYVGGGNATHAERTLNFNEVSKYLVRRTLRASHGLFYLLQHKYFILFLNISESWKKLLLYLCRSVGVSVIYQVYLEPHT